MICRHLEQRRMVFRRFRRGAFRPHGRTTHQPASGRVSQTCATPSRPADESPRPPVSLRQNTVSPAPSPTASPSSPIPAASSAARKPSGASTDTLPPREQASHREPAIHFLKPRKHRARNSIESPAKSIAATSAINHERQDNDLQDIPHGHLRRRIQGHLRLHHP